jgi:hypothetical protein
VRDLHLLVDSVQRNCHVADARHAREMTMCTYLLEMREFYRWECGMTFAETPRREELSRWLAEREALWGELESADYRPVPVGGELIDPFEAPAVNRALLPEGLVYGAGIGRFGKPHFFLGQLARREQRDGLEVLVADCEYARDITGMTAALQGDAIILRREVLARWLWEKFETWGVRKSDGPLKSALLHYGFDREPQQALRHMTERESETMILHELGEARAGRLLGPRWEAMLAALTSRKAELVVRAVRDNLADCLVTVPVLVERDARVSLEFHFANFEGMRRAIFPALADAYRRWSESADPSALLDAARRGAEHWSEVGRNLLESFTEDPQRAQSAIEALAEDRREP